jgi:hypothetical protein
MKTTILYVCLTAVASAQVCPTAPSWLAVTKTNGQIRLEWPRQSNTNWNLYLYDSPGGIPIASFPLSTNVYFDSPPENVTARFYRVGLTNPPPCLRILSPAAGATLTGLSQVIFDANLAGQLSAATILIDDLPLWTTNAVSPMPLPTSYLSNGTHKISIRVFDAADPNGRQASVIASIVVNVQNNVWLNLGDAFGDFLPIEAHSAYANATYTIAIENEAGTPVKTFSGTTANGNINVTWNGLDSSNNDTPEDAVYYVTVSTSPSSTAPSGASGIGMFGGTSNDSTTKPVYKEIRSWITQSTILARQAPLTWIPIFNGTWVAISTAKLATIFDLTQGDSYRSSDVAPSGLGPVQVLPADNYNTLLNLLGTCSGCQWTRPTQFYWDGHGNPDAIGSTAGYITTKHVAGLLGNYSYISMRTGSPVKSYRHPYKFVFLDACQSGSEAWASAFGILPIPTYDYAAADGRRQRAFMGWRDVAENSLFGNENAYNRFTVNFFTAWIGNPQSTLEDAVSAGLAGNAYAVEINGNLVVYGFHDLTWAY